MIFFDRIVSKAVSQPLATLPTHFSPQFCEGHGSITSSSCCITHRPWQKSGEEDGPPVVLTICWIGTGDVPVKMVRSAVILLLSADPVSAGLEGPLVWSPEPQNNVWGSGGTDWPLAFEQLGCRKSLGYLQKCLVPQESERSPGVTVGFASIFSSSE